MMHTVRKDKNMVAMALLDLEHQNLRSWPFYEASLSTTTRGIVATRSPISGGSGTIARLSITWSPCTLPVSVLSGTE
jgi:hypothetical protein